MANIQVGATVRIGSGKKAIFGTVITAPAETVVGRTVTVKYLPDFQHLSAAGGADYLVTELTEVRVCACATLAYRPQFGDNKGELFTTGCDYSRMPGRNSKFLPGHDAKAKGFLIKASQLTSQMENGKGALETARELGDKISMKVAEGMDNERRKRDERARSRRQSADTIEAVAQREDTLTPAQQLQREHKVTAPMMAALARSLTTHDGRIVGVATGTALAMKKRGLVSWGDVTYLGRSVMNYPVLENDKVACSDDEGSYVRHTGHTSGCKRCGCDWDENQIV